MYIFQYVNKIIILLTIISLYSNRFTNNAVNELNLLIKS